MFDHFSQTSIRQRYVAFYGSTVWNSVPCVNMFESGWTPNVIFSDSDEHHPTPLWRFSDFDDVWNVMAYTCLKPRSHCVRRRTSMLDTADDKLYAAWRCYQWAQLRCRTYGSTCRARFVRHVASVDVRRRSVCERCRTNQRARLQRRRT